MMYVVGTPARSQGGLRPLSYLVHSGRTRALLSRRGALYGVELLRAVPRRVAVRA